MVGCKKQGKKQYNRKENCRRHYQKRHPLLDLRLVGL